MLVRDVAREFGPDVKVSIEEYGNSPMATRFGVRRYPVVFVDDVLFARPKDFGFGGPEDVGGAYVPWLDPGNQRRFKADLHAAVARRLSGATIAGHDIADVTTASDAADGPPVLPGVALKDITGRVIDPASLAGHPVVIEMWATWCPPCRSTLRWLKTLQTRSGSRVTVVAIAVDSKVADVRALTSSLKPSYRIVMGIPDVLKAFGDVAAVPKMLIYDAAGRRSKVLFGAPPDLHQQIDAAIKAVAR